MTYSIHMNTLGEFILMRDKIEIALLDIAPGKTLEEARQMVMDLNSADATRQMLCEKQDELAALRAKVAELERDKARLDWLEALRDRHKMVGCHKGKMNPNGFRRYDCESDIHLRTGSAAVYLRNELGNVVQSGNAPTLRVAIDAAKEGTL